MRFPHLSVPRTARKALTPTGLSLPTGTDTYAFTYTENLITEDGITRTHPPRTLLAAPDGGDGLAVAVTAVGEELCYIDGRDVVVGERRYPMALGGKKHRLIPFGDLLLILPERKYLRLSDGLCGSLDAELTTEGSVLFTLCRADGSPYLPLSVAVTAPSAPTHGDHWLDTAFKPLRLCRYDALREEWQSVSDTYLRLSSPGIGKSFRIGDTVRFSGIVPTELKHLEGLHRLIGCGEDHLVISAPPCLTLRQITPLTVSRRMPDIDPDTVLLWRDRLIGAARDTDGHGTDTTVLCACRVGDPFNWACDGDDPDGARTWQVAHAALITASAVYDGMPHFFGEQSLLRLSGESTSAQWRLTPLDGVMRGCGESLQEVGGMLLYRARRGMMCYDGRRATALPSLPWDTLPRAAAAGVLGERYYLSLTEEDGRANLLVYHVGDRVWSRLDHTRAVQFVPYAGGLCYRDGCNAAIRALTDGKGDDLSEVRWLAETAPIFTRDGEGKRLCRLELMLTLAEDCEAQIQAKSDEGILSPPIEICGRGQTPICVPVYPHGDDHITLCIRGRGEVALLRPRRITR